MSRFIWWAALALIGSAAAGMTSWSLYVVAHDIYGVPKALAFVTAAVFDGTAIACLYLANEAVRERRSALAPHAATLGTAAISVYLNRLHAAHIHGGLGAVLLFAAPTIALLVLCGLAWSATRARLRDADGDRPVSLRHYGFWGWVLAGPEAWKATKSRAVEHVTSLDTVRTESGPPARKPRGATDALREHFAAVHPADAILTAAEAKPGATPQQLADELAVYGVHVTAVGVALVLGQPQPSVRIDRPDPSGPAPAAPLTALSTPALTSPDPDPDLPGPRPATITDAVRHLVDRGVTDEPTVMDTVPLLLGKQTKPDTVRRTLGKVLDERARVQPQRDASGIGKGGGGYA